MATLTRSLSLSSRQASLNGTHPDLERCLRDLNFNVPKPAAKSKAGERWSDAIHSVQLLNAACGAAFERLEDARILHGAFVHTSVAPGDIVYAEGDEGDSLFLLTEGSVELSSKNSSTPEVILMAPAIFGELRSDDLRPGAPERPGAPRRAATVTSGDDGACFRRVLKEDFDRVADDAPELREALHDAAARSVATRKAAAAEELGDFAPRPRSREINRLYSREEAALPGAIYAMLLRESVDEEEEEGEDAENERRAGDGQPYSPAWRTKARAVVRIAAKHA